MNRSGKRIKNIKKLFSPIANVAQNKSLRKNFFIRFTDSKRI